MSRDRPRAVAEHLTATAYEARIALILERVGAIPRGFVRTYGDIDPVAPRLVGRVLSTVHDDSLPWHRVVRADGRLAKGARQLERLRREGVPLVGDRVDLEQARLPTWCMSETEPAAPL